MTKKYAALVAGDINPIGMEPKGIREMWDSLAKDLEGNQEENQRGVKALTNWREALGNNDPEQENPAEPPLAEGTPSKDLGTSVREGAIAPTELSKTLFKTATGLDFPGTGEVSEQEMKTQDQWEGFRAADYQTGKEPRPMENAILEGMGGRDEKAKGQEAGQEMTWGPSRMMKGLLTGNVVDYAKGAMETIGSGLDMGKQIKDQLGLNGGPNALQKMKTGMEEKGNEIGEMLGLGKDGAIGSTAGALKEQGKSAVNTVADTLGKALEGTLAGKLMKAETGVIDTLAEAVTGNAKALQSVGKMLLPLNPASSLSEVSKAFFGDGDKEKGGKEKDGQATPSFAKEDGSMDQGAVSDFASKLSSAVAYKKSRKAGLPSKDAGPAAETAGEITAEATKTPQKSEMANQAIDKGAAALKAGKDLAVKAASKALAAIPGVGTALSVGLQVANVVANIAIDAMKETAKDAVGPAANTPGNPGTEQEKPQGGEVKNQGPNAMEISGEMAQAGAGPSPGAGGFKEALRKGKGKLLKELIPAGDLTEGAIGGLGKMAGKGIAAVAGTASRDASKPPPEGVLEMNQ